MSDSQAENGSPQGPRKPVLDRAMDLVKFLREGCPWDAAQTHHSLRRYLLEEAHEVVDAIDASSDDDLKSELGDLLLNLAFQVVLAEERSAFSRDDVVAGLEAKMKRRHPHLYGGAPANWDEIKAQERGVEASDERSVLADSDLSSDALRNAHIVQKKAASVGFDWPNVFGPVEKLREEVEEIAAAVEEKADAAALEDEIGDLLFSVVNFARHVDLHAPTALMRANRKFVHRFRAVEALAKQRGIELQDATIEELDVLWDEVKREQR